MGVFYPLCAQPSVGAASHHGPEENRRPRRAPAQPEKHQPGDPAEYPDGDHRAFRVRANPRWLSTPFTPRGSVATWSRSRPTPASFWTRWSARKSIRSRGFRRPLPSSRRPPRARRGPRSAPSPKFTTTCAWFTARSARRTARNADSRSSRQSTDQIVRSILQESWPRPMIA